MPELASPTPTLNGTVASPPNGAVGQPPTVSSPVSVEATDPILSSDEAALFKALVARGKRNLAQLTFDSLDEESFLVDQVVRDFEDNFSGNGQYVRNVAELWANWRGTTEPKSFPFDGCSNVRQPLTSVYVETMLARIIKAILGGDFVAKMSYLNKHVDNSELVEANAWFKWELTETVKIYKWFVNCVRNVLITGISVNIPCYSHETRYLHSKREFDLSEQTGPESPTGTGGVVGARSALRGGVGQAGAAVGGSRVVGSEGGLGGVAPMAQVQSLSELIEQAIQQIINEPNDWGTEEPLAVVGQRAPGDFRLNDDGRLVFSLTEDGRALRADIWRNETIFDGVRINQIQLEDLACPATHESLDEAPFFGVRCWYDIAKYRSALKDGFFIDLGEDENKRIIGMADVKQGEALDMPITDLQDAEESTDSTGSSMTSDPSRQFIEVYRWEGWWVWGTSNSIDQIDRALQPATQVAVWVAVKARRIIKIERLEDLNKDGKRSGVKFGFIEEPNRFFPMGLAEWVRHLQTVGDAIWNQRLDSGLLYNVPFGFYKPTAGMASGAQPISIEPGKFFPVADPQGINMPRSNWQPAFSFAEEQLVREYAGEQAGLSGGATGRSISKRQSATEFQGIAQAIDLRTEMFVESLLSSLRELLYRILGLYQQFGPRTRIFRLGGEGGVSAIKQFERSRLQGKLFLDMAGSLAQINEQTQRQVALDMLQIIMEPLWTQIAVVGPDTMFAAIKKLADLMHYDVPLHKPKLDPISDSPDVEEQQMFVGQRPAGPTLGEDTHEHMAHHSRTAADARLMVSWPPESRALLSAHMQETMKTEQAQQVVAQQRAALAAQMAQSMTEKGIRPGKAGQQQSNESVGPGTQAEGVATAGAGASSAAAAPQNQ